MNGEGGLRRPQWKLKPRMMRLARSRPTSDKGISKQSIFSQYSLSIYPIIATFDRRRQLLDQIAGTTVRLAMQSHSETYVAIVTVEGIG